METIFIVVALMFFSVVIVLATGVVTIISDDPYSKKRWCKSQRTSFRDCSHYAHKRWRRVIVDTGHSEVAELPSIGRLGASPTFPVVAYPFVDYENDTLEYGVAIGYASKIGKTPRVLVSYILKKEDVSATTLPFQKTRQLRRRKLVMSLHEMLNEWKGDISPENEFSNAEVHIPVITPAARPLFVTVNEQDVPSVTEPPREF